MLSSLLLAAYSLLAADAPAVSDWVNVSEAFTQQIGIHDIRPDYTRRCLGMAVVPTGEVFLLTTGKGLCVSNDQGATWAVVEGNKVNGRCTGSFSFSVAYPYDGRIAVFSIDGTGGITLDGGKAWRPFTRILRSFEFSDVDWNANPQTIYGLLHEPFFTVLSPDGGSNWQQIYTDAEAINALGGDGQRLASRYCLGIIDAKTLVRSHLTQSGISLSTDAGKTWSEVAKYKVLGRRPVHYGKKLYWTTTEGVVVSTNGKDWSLTGKGPENAALGPFFGANEQEFMVVSDKAFFITRDGGKTWRDVAPAFFPPDARTPGFGADALNNYIGWDAKHNLIYASSLGGSVYRLQLK